MKKLFLILFAFILFANIGYTQKNQPTLSQKEKDTVSKIINDSLNNLRKNTPTGSKDTVYVTRTDTVYSIIYHIDTVLITQKDTIVIMINGGSTAGWINLADYFPNGDIPDETDITDELQNALNTGLNVIIPAGKTFRNYRISRMITMSKSGQIIQGPGMEGTRIAASYGFSDPAMFELTGYWMQIKDLHLNGFGAKVGLWLHWAHCYNNTFTNLFIEGFFTSASDTGCGVKIDTSISHQFYNCRISGNEVGIKAYYSNAISIFGGQYVKNMIAQFDIGLCYQWNMYGGDIEAGGLNVDYLVILQNAAFNMYGVYTESATIADIFVKGDNQTATYIGIYDGRIGTIDLDSCRGIISCNLTNTWLQFSVNDSYQDIPIHFTPSLHHGISSVNLTNVTIVRLGWAGIGVFNIWNYASDMYRGDKATLWEYLVYDKDKHHCFINNR